MTNEPFTLDRRTTDFSKNIIQFCKSERISIINRSLIEQLIRSSTSIGANYAEANNASSKTDFRNKIYIAKKETAETKYWLSLLIDLVEDKDSCRKLLEDSHYLLMTFQKIVNTLQSKQKTVKVR